MQWVVGGGRFGKYTNQRHTWLTAKKKKRLNTQEQQYTRGRIAAVRFRREENGSSAKKKGGDKKKSNNEQKGGSSKDTPKLVHVKEACKHKVCMRTSYVNEVWENKTKGCQFIIK